jgi:hypothetical protein
MGVQTQLRQGNPFDCLSVGANSRANLSKSKREDGKDRIQLIRLTGRMGAGGGKRLVKYVAIS